MDPRDKITGPQEGKVSEPMGRFDETARRYRELFEGSRDGYVLVDANGRFLEANPAYCAMVGYTLEELRGLTDFYQITPESWWAWEREVIWNDRLLGQGYSGVYEKEYRRKDGTVFPIELQAYTSVDEHGAIRYIWGVTRDITAQKRAQAVLMQSEAHLRQSQKMEALGRMAGEVAHDFNNMLFAIRSYLELAQHELSPDHPAGSLLEEADLAAQHAYDFTQQLLQFSRASMGKPRNVPIIETIQRYWSLLQRLVGKDIAVRLEAEEDVGALQLDPHQLAQILTNLVANARDAMPDGGDICISVATVHREEVPALGSMVEAEGYVKVAVSDTGQGMDAQTLAHMFEPFYTTKPAGKGTGLGLSTVYRIVEQLGGVIGVESHLGQGTCLSLYFPRVIQPVSHETNAIVRVNDDR